jgi:hypothetical protein
MRWARGEGRWGLERTTWLNRARVRRKIPFREGTWGMEGYYTRHPFNGRRKAHTKDEAATGQLVLRRLGNGDFP